MYISRKMPKTLLLSLPPAVMPYAISRKFSSAWMLFNRLYNPVNSHWPVKISLSFRQLFLWWLTLCVYLYWKNSSRGEFLGSRFVEACFVVESARSRALESAGGTLWFYLWKLVCWLLLRALEALSDVTSCIRFFVNWSRGWFGEYVTVDDFIF